MTNLQNLSISDRLTQQLHIHPEQSAGDRLQRRELARVNCRSLVLLESVYEEPSVTEVAADDRSRTTTLAPTRCRHTLLIHMSTQVGVD
jgi:hypothetical protein